MKFFILGSDGLVLAEKAHLAFDAYVTEDVCRIIDISLLKKRVEKSLEYLIIIFSQETLEKIYQSCPEFLNHTVYIRDEKESVPSSEGWKDLFWKGSYDEFFEEQLSKFVREKSDHGFVPVKIFRFLKANSFNCNLYIRVSESKFLKIWDKKDKYGQDDIQKYVDKGIDSLYIETNDLEKFTNYYLDLFSDFQSVETSKTTGLRDNTLTQQEYLSLLHTKMSTLNVSEQVMEQADVYINQMGKTLSKSVPQLSQVIKLLLKSRGGITEYSLTTSYISTMVAQKLGWKSSEIHDKLIAVSIFHDSALLNREDLFNLSFIDKDTLEKMNDFDRKIILNHPQKIVMKLASAKGRVPDIESLILNHHELPAGNGYPRMQSYNNIPMLNVLFNMTSFFTRRISSSEELDKSYVISVVAEMNKMFSAAYYQKILRVFNKVFDDEL